MCKLLFTSLNNAKVQTLVGSTETYGMGTLQQQLGGQHDCQGSGSSYFPGMVIRVKYTVLCIVLIRPHRTHIPLALSNANAIAGYS